MAKKSKKIEKETRRLMESMSDLVKKKGDRYKFKTGKKKQVRKFKRSCVHWIYRKGKEYPTVRQDPQNPNQWKCAICGATFPISPLTQAEYTQIEDNFLEIVNQLQFWSVKMGGDASDTKLFLKLKSEVPQLAKIQKAILKQVNKRKEWEDRRTNSDSLSQFDSYAGFNYRV